MEGDRNRYLGAAGHTLVVMDAGDSDIAFRVELNEGGDPDGDVVLLHEQVGILLDDLVAMYNQEET